MVFLLFLLFFPLVCQQSQEVPHWYSMIEFIDNSEDPSSDDANNSESPSDLEQGLLQFFNSFSLAQDKDGNKKDDKRHSW